MSQTQRAEFKRQHQYIMQTISEMTAELPAASAEAQRAQRAWAAITATPPTSWAPDPDRIEAMEAASLANRTLETLNSQIRDLREDADRLKAYIDCPTTFAKARTARDALLSDLHAAEDKLKATRGGQRKLEAQLAAALLELEAARDAETDSLLAEAISDQAPDVVRGTSGRVDKLQSDVDRLEHGLERAAVLVQVQVDALEDTRDRLGAASWEMMQSAALAAEVEHTAALDAYLPKLARLAATRRKATGWSSFSMPDLDWEIAKYLEAHPETKEEPETMAA